MVQKKTLATDNVNFDNIIYNTAITFGLTHDLSLLVTYQARYETNDYKSNVFKQNNNAFGYKYIGQKKWVIGGGTSAAKTDAQGNPDGGIYAKYPSIEYSVGEIVDYYKRRIKQGYKFDKLQNTDTMKFAELLKQAQYYGITARQYGSGLQAKLNKTNINIA